MLDYDLEAARYDETRGGRPRAEAAATALAELLPSTTRTVLDLAGGTGLIAESLTSKGFQVYVCDRSTGMLRLAAERVPGRVLRSDATALPVRDGAVDAVSMIWLLHLLPDAAPVLDECVRVLRPGGLLLTTVDKNTAMRDADGRPSPDLSTRTATDARETIERLAAERGLTLHGETTFVGYGQGRLFRPIYRLLSFRRTQL